MRNLFYNIRVNCFKMVSIACFTLLCNTCIKMLCITCFKTLYITCFTILGTTCFKISRIICFKILVGSRSPSVRTNVSAVIRLAIAEEAINTARTCSRMINLATVTRSAYCVQQRAADGLTALGRFLRCHQPLRQQFYTVCY